MITSVLVGLCGTRYSEAVVNTAIDVAKTHNASLTAITALNVKALRNVGPVPVGASQAANELRDYRVQVTRDAIDESVADFEAKCQAAGLPYRVKQEERDQPYDFLASRSRYHDLTVLNLRGIFEYDIRSAVESDPSLTLVRLLGDGVRPILAVPESTHEVRRVFVGYSGSMESAATLRRFLQLRPYNHIDLTIATFEMDEARSKRLLTHAARYCEGHGVHAVTRHYSMPARDQLLVQAAADGADLIVLGNSAKSLLMRRVLGETALRAIRESEIPLFLSQ